MAGSEKRRHDRGGGGGSNKKSRKEKGRAAWSRDQVNRRERNEATQQRRAELGEEGKPIYVIDFSKEEIESEERQPKKKVAILFGYSGSGFSGLQITHKERTVEGELFKACVQAGAVSKANADDPKKISWVRCARTDKGVHAAGNVLSTKLILGEGVVQQINSKLPPEIRIWGLERTVSSFSAYHFCDSRIYEYLIPTYCFLPPHPRSFLGEQLVSLAQKAKDEDGYNSRQKEVGTFWETTEAAMEPVLSECSPAIRKKALEIIFNGNLQQFKRSQLNGNLGSEAAHVSESEEADATESSKAAGADGADQEDLPDLLKAAIKTLKQAYREAKLAYRIDAARLSRVRSALERYVGTHSYHNYTVKKKLGDPSAKRHIKSFVAASAPIHINGTEWLSLKVHGQSFMMHQIRKMVFMAAMAVRCGADDARLLPESFARERVSIPKAPGLGLLLERPVFEAYNEKKRGASHQNEWGPIDFEQFTEEMEEFKQREIYDRIYREEERDGTFYHLWSSVDSLRSSQLLYLSSMGMEAAENQDWKGDEEVDEVVFDDENEEQADS